MSLDDCPDGYALLKCLHRSSRSEAHAATRRTDGRTVVLKAYSQDRDGSAAGDTKARREFEMLRRIAGPGVPEAIEMLPGSEAPILVLEHVPGIPLSSWAAGAPVQPEPFLEVATQLARVLARTHAVHVIHRDLHPGNVLVDPRTLRCHLVDFGAAQTLGGTRHMDASSGQCTVGPLRYTSPEQTGRMNRGIDSRSDLYSLGANLYHALVGHPPFDTNDPLSLVHAHMARPPQPPTELRPDLPPVLSNIILKLLEKEPESRYQTATGLLHDLEACLQQLRSTGRLEGEVTLGKADAPLHPLFTKNLHGREAELEALLGAYASACEGRPQLVLIQGGAGSGKSALVHALSRPVAKSRGYLATAKFDLYRREVPYAGWTSLLTSFADQLLTESETRLEMWRAELRTALRSLAGTWVEMVPELHLVLGDVSAPPKVGPKETQARLALAAQRFMRGVATADHPFVLFLDDMQWADSGSCHLLQAILEESHTEHMVIVAAYREAETPTDQAFQRLLTRLGELPLEVRRIDLGPLDVAATASMLAEALGREPSETRRLATTVLQKTGRNPLLVQQFVGHMHSRGLIRFRAPDGWTWDDDEILAAGVLDGDVPFMVDKLRELAPALRDLIEFASCIADEFDVELLADLSDRARDDLEPSLFALVEEGLIAPSAKGFRFAHDRIREAAQSLLSDERRARVHWDTARHLLTTHSARERAARVFEIADHINRSGALVSADWRMDAIDCNFLAGTRALRAGAGAAARSYFAAAQRMLCAEDWSERRALCLEIVLNGAESAYLMSEFDDALALLDQIEPLASRPVEFGRIAVKRIQVFAMRDTVGESLPYTLAALARVGLRWPATPSTLRLLFAIVATEWFLLRGKAKIDAGMAPDPDAEADRRRAPLEIIEASGAIMLRSSTFLFALAVCWALRCQLRHGTVNSAAYSLAGYAAGIALNVQSARRAARLADVALAWDRAAPHPLYSGRVQLIVYGIIRPFALPRREALHPLTEAIERMMEMGDPEFAYYAINTKLILGMLGGDPLAQARNDLRATEPIRRRIGYRDDETQCVLRAVELLCEPNAESIDWTRGAEEPEDWLAEHPGCNEPQVRTAWLLLYCVHGRYEVAFEHSERIWRRIFDSHVLVHVVDHTFLRGIAAAELARLSSGRARRRYRRAFTDCLRRLRRWSDDSPDFVHMAQGLAAERAWLRGSLERARSLYHQAANRALRQGYSHHAALLHERRSRLLVAARRETEARKAREESALLYRQWGAVGRARALVSEGANPT